ncbi:MAG: M20 family metallopeptidase [Spirochaetia bacterium]|jgi:amidohydrolase|nr:M20 family metallopeptidase [Spirochaetia bacterium]
MNDHKAILVQAEAMKEWLVRIRRDLHSIPEPGDAEHKTQEYLCKVLDDLGIPYRKMRTAVVGLVEGAAPGPVVALRADMDALPAQEPEDRPYRSRHSGYMHACGHDAHMTVALGAARFFAEHKDQLTGTIKLLFQPAEETTGGAEPMIADGCLENPHVDYVLGLHVMPDLPTGLIELKHGALNGASDYLGIKIYGKGAHAAYPSTGIDAIMIAAKIVDSLQSVISRNVSPLDEAVITIGTINGGQRNNIIAEEVNMTGTIRTTSTSVRKEIAQRVTSIVQNIPAALGGSGEVEIKPGYTALINHDAVVDLIAEEAKALFGDERVLWREKPSLGVEDFAFYLQQRPGAFYHLGCGGSDTSRNAPLHSKLFDIDERCLPAGVAIQTAAALRLLKEGS